MLFMLVLPYYGPYLVVIHVSIALIFFMLDSSTCWAGHVLRCMIDVGYRVPLICIVPLLLVGYVFTR